jgi:hypothetical protein
MKATTDELRIGHGIPDEKGQPLEPEEQPVDRVIGTILPVTLGNAPGEGAPVETPMRGRVTVEGTALDAAVEFTEQCYLCEHWDQAAYRDARQRGLYAPSYLDEQRVHVLELASADELDQFERDRADKILDVTHGRCRVLSELLHDMIDSHARAHCPAADAQGNPLENMFKARREARGDVVQIRDRILLTASGRRPS